MIIDNTNRLFPVAQPRSFLRSRGYMDGLSGDADTSILGLTMTDIQQIVTGLNSQQLFSLNLQRAAAGLPALNPAQYAPQVAVGLNADTQKMLMIGAAALLAVMLLKKA